MSKFTAVCVIFPQIIQGQMVVAQLIFWIKNCEGMLPVSVTLHLGHQPDTSSLMAEEGGWIHCRPLIGRQMIYDDDNETDDFPVEEIIWGSESIHH